MSRKKYQNYFTDSLKMVDYSWIRGIVSSVFQKFYNVVIFFLWVKILPSTSSSFFEAWKPGMVKRESSLLWTGFTALEVAIMEGASIWRWLGGSLNWEGWGWGPGLILKQVDQVRRVPQYYFYFWKKKERKNSSFCQLAPSPSPLWKPKKS